MHKSISSVAIEHIVANTQHAPVDVVIALAYLICRLKALEDKGWESFLDTWEFVDIDYVYIPYFPATEKNSVKSFCDLIDEMRVGTTCVITVLDYCTFSEKYKKVREKIIHEGMLKQMIRIDGSLLYENVKGDYYILILKKNTCSFLLVSGKRL